MKGSLTCMCVLTCPLGHKVILIIDVIMWRVPSIELLNLFRESIFQLRYAQLKVVFILITFHCHLEGELHVHAHVVHVCLT